MSPTVEPTSRSQLRPQHLSRPIRTRRPIVASDQYVRKPQARKRGRTGRRVVRAIKHVEDSVHYSVAILLIGIAIVMLAETILALLRTSSPFSTAASNAVGGVLVALIIVEITRTVITSPDNNGMAVRKLLVIAIISVLREMLLMGTNSVHGGSTSAAMINKPLQLGVSTAVIIGLAVSFAVVRRSSAEE